MHLFDWPFILCRFTSTPPHPSTMQKASTRFISLLSTCVSLLALPTPTEIQACWELCRLHSNIGFWVVWLPTAWSITMAFRAQPDLTLAEAVVCAMTYVPLCFGVKSLIMTIDDLLDYDIDGLVERTKGRALPRGAISLPRAWTFFVIQVIIGIPLALLTLSRTALLISMAVWPLYIIYPTCKRWTYFAPIPLGFMFTVGVFMGWSDVSLDGTIPWHILVPIYFSTILWTFTYETVYQHQDKMDDINLGIYSAALFLLQRTVPVCAATAVGFFLLLAYGGVMNGHGITFLASVVVAAVDLFSGLLGTNVDNPAECKKFFLATPRIGQWVLGGLVADSLLHRFLEGTFKIY
ncbi:hypothetical protein MIND_01185100 [Mycena indigotica]|uniref:Uncharacterized protein n=1 Tax=Mycena indigotica TaxID=2126181 RepID=A0A8H6VUX0_9AGAR|nr:uncharacterized protein MIND_01185100 [Mycena indigotica]KAF7292861.1 hypothetical protein MIND_01185100 [Mycena indigotica]